MKALTVCSRHVTYAFQSESTLYSCLNVKNSLLETGAKVWSVDSLDMTKHAVKCTVQISTHNTPQSFSQFG